MLVYRFIFVIYFNIILICNHKFNPLQLYIFNSLVNQTNLSNVGFNGDIIMFFFTLFEFLIVTKSFIKTHTH